MARGGMNADEVGTLTQPMQTANATAVTYSHGPRSAVHAAPAVGSASAPSNADSNVNALGPSMVAAPPCDGKGTSSGSAASPTAASTQAVGTHPTVQEAVDYEVSPTELGKWSEMIDMGIAQCKRQHPDRFHRRVRRGIPPKYRWQVWKAAVEVHHFELPKNYDALSNMEHRWTSAIEIDIGRTFPELKSFDRDQQLRLLRVLNAYAAYNPDVGYCQGMNFVAGLLLLVSDSEQESFRVLVRLMDHVGLSGFYTERLPLLRKYLKTCDRLVAETVPDLRDHFIRENVQPAVYLHQWFLTLFINCFPLPMVLIIWDVIICEGLPVILRIAVSILQVLKDSLLSMHFEEIIKFFKMMKTYEDEDGELNAFRIGQLLMKHTEHVVIPERVLEHLNREWLDEEVNMDSDEIWEADLNGGGWFQSITRVFTFGSSRRGVRASDSRATASSSGSGRALAAPEAPPQQQHASAAQSGSNSGSVARNAGGGYSSGAGSGHTSVASAGNSQHDYAATGGSGGGRHGQWSGNDTSNVEEAATLPMQFL